MEKRLALKNVIFRDKNKFFDKINFLFQGGIDNIHLLLDFDRTLTKSRHKSGKDISTWEILGNHLSAESKKAYRGLYEKYRPLELKNKLRAADAVLWWEGVLKLFKKDKLKWSDIAKDVEINLPIRPGAKELFEFCKERNIPTIIISAGIKDVIELWCQKLEIFPTLVLSTNLTFSPEGIMNGWHKESLIHALNKKEKGHKEVEKIRLVRPNTILVGDDMNDSAMIDGEEKVLRIGVYDSLGTDDNEMANKFNGKFDLVIKDGKLQSVIKILKFF